MKFNVTLKRDEDGNVGRGMSFAPWMCQSRKNEVRGPQEYEASHSIMC